MAVASLTRQLGYAVHDRAVAASLTRLLASSEDAVFCAVHDVTVVGWLHARVATSLQAGSFLAIEGLVVGERWQRRGVATALLDEGLRWAADCGLTAIRVRSRTTRAGAHQFYLSSGFTIEKTSLTFVFAVPQGEAASPDD